MGQKFPRPKDINFPEAQKKNVNLKMVQKTDELDTRIARNITLLKSGNVLISYLEADRENFKIKSNLLILDVPDLNIVEKYEFDIEENNTFYLLDFSTQLNNGNIITICDKLYKFNGESISQGPKEESEKIKNLYFSENSTKFYESDDTEHNNPIQKRIKQFNFNNFIEVKEGILLYTNSNESNYHIYNLDTSKSKVERESLFKYIKEAKSDHYKFNILHKSEYYPENFYICGNMTIGSKKESALFIFNIDEFCDETQTTKQPSSIIEVDKSQLIYAICEYDKKYILLDTFKKGIYIIDIETKQKVAISIPKVYVNNSNSLFNHYGNIKDEYGTIYKKMIKLKGGCVILDESFFIADIREQKMKETGYLLSLNNFVVAGNYFIHYGKGTYMHVVKIEEE